MIKIFGYIIIKAADFPAWEKANKVARTLSTNKELKPILDVWEQYKHLDILLSDEEWMKDDDYPMTPQRRCLYDLWKAVKEVVAGTL